MIKRLKKIFGDQNSKEIKKLQPIVQKINDLEEEISALSDDKLKDKTKEFKERLNKKESLDNILPEAFAVVRETSKRTLGQRHYDTQLMGGIGLHKGSISEMRTGEGKTLVATLPVYLNALLGESVHVVTVNDYLSRRDAVWMGQIYAFLGLSIGVIGHDSSFVYDSTHIKTEEGKEDDKERDSEGSYKVVDEFLRPCSRQEAYKVDITYGTNSEFGFDYLRDNIEHNKENLRQRGYSFVIVDEIDSILIDEARTPLIISIPDKESGGLYAKFSQISQGLKEGEDFEIDEKKKAISLKDSGIEKAEKALGVGNIYTEKGIKYVHHLETAVRAKSLFKLNKHYVVKDGSIIIVDEFTGRMQPGRRWSEGLHQAIEAKEGLKVQNESRTFASITYQNYFRMYKKLSGMTGTAQTSAEEFLKVYGLDVLVLPTNKPIQRKDENDLIFQTKNGKFQAIAREVKELNKKGQPILIGTVSIENNELLSAYLNKEGIKHEILNAKNHEREGEIVAAAGEKGKVTVATNMAGRGVDIKLGGLPFDENKKKEVLDLGGLFVLGTERHEARRVDNQLRGRTGRQGDVGQTQFFVSMEDSLMRVFASSNIKGMMGKLGIPEDQPIENKMVSKALESAQTKIEGFHFDSRRHVLQYDDVLNHQRQIVYSRRRDVLLGDDKLVSDKFNEILETGEKEIINTITQKRLLIGDKDFLDIVRKTILQTIDMFWVDHLELMDYLRSSVNLRAYGQRDPLVEYKREGLQLFKEMQNSINEHILKLIPRLDTETFLKNREAMENSGAVEMNNIKQEAEKINASTSNQSLGTTSTKSEKVGRNDPCPCGAKKSDGSSIKYKNCCGK
ncbi:MAG: preprotein translocase subunit SecA [Candidatus Pacebacteria bacterium]|nr:preprotein translocase subunit SecA [Candidatus Paceibacterota bacterium]